MNDLTKSIKCYKKMSDIDPDNVSLIKKCAKLYAKNK